MSDNERFYNIRVVVKAKHGVGIDSIPVGAAHQYEGDVPPEGHVWGEGQTLSRHDYPELYAVLKRPLPSWRYPFKRLRAVNLRVQHKFVVPDFRKMFATATRRDP